MLNHYEAVFILTPVLSDVQMKEAVEKFKTVITDNQGTITNEENWGMRKLAYPIQKKSTGFYTLLQFDADPSFIAMLETQFRRDERVLRFLTFRLDKYAYEYAEKRKHSKSQQNETTEVNEKSAKKENETKDIEEKEN
jgi:small subunit ribosomal protein S6